MGPARSGARDVDEGLPRHREEAVGDPLLTASAPALSGGPVQGAAVAAHEVPHHRSAFVLRGHGLLEDPGRPDEAGDHGAAALLPDAGQAGPDLTLVPADDPVAAEQRPQL